MVTIADAWPALAGTAIGAVAAIGGGLLGQTAISRREATDRKRKEARVRALFITHAKQCHSILKWQVESAGVPLDEFTAAAEPLTRFLADQSLVLALEPEAIDTVTRAVQSLGLCVRVARQIRERTAGRLDQNTARKLELLDSEDLQIKSTFKMPFGAFEAALRDLGDPDFKGLREAKK